MKIIKNYLLIIILQKITLNKFKNIQTNKHLVKFLFIN